jgi:hypothetical protein
VVPEGRSSGKIQGTQERLTNEYCRSSSYPSPVAKETWLMECPRCAGLMMSYDLAELRHFAQPVEVNCWRCLMCGEILDPVIIANRQSRPSTRADRARQNFALQTS